MSTVTISDLAPIVLPEAPGLWPLAPGWWLLIVLVLALIVTMSLMVIKQRQFWRIKHLALTKVQATEQVGEINQLLKQVAIHYYGANRVAALQGQSWTDFINQGLNNDLKTLNNQINQHLYHRDNNHYLEQFKHIASTWLKQLDKKAFREAKHA
ncbi:DUF4381 domain-containing protein [Psychrobium sp. 1_MG-2023]|uniref:DUF4381 domain-containing protein n=1 Tax=Psychrobium sp. 1_MG-2023 TaxID=3062624 RepID=UPI000C31FFE3|nr:DUF4381 domain-containing protein [Psychrobium sp. 1_MG-2023]MDP2561736.1 DUF4381 domain-containing protein [Psychrobium sp. 1_MG-2023]PKF59775.1 hypothetical protein CW748_00830 [Alteromonadales bacterium alter-6D02]